MADERPARPEPLGRPAQARRRGAELEDAILRAAAEELTESGYAGLTMDRVARRAATNKNTIYRRWPNRAALGIAAYRQLAAAAVPSPDTGELRGDALELIRRTNRSWSSATGRILRALLAGARDDPQLLAQIQEHSADTGSAAWLAILARAVARGEAPAEALHLRVAGGPGRARPPGMTDLLTGKFRRGGGPRKGGTDGCHGTGGSAHRR